MEPDQSLNLSLPACGQRVIDALESAGHEAWAVGGWVRDALRGGEAHDVDVTTDAHWEQTAQIMREAGCAVHETGTAHGTVTVVVDGQPVEVTTYRTESGYSDARHPDKVTFVTDVREDLARRDFTVNAMAWHPTRGLLDPFEGRYDLQRRCIRCAGDPAERFGEDALRVLRAVRFAARMGFSIDGTTQRALDAAAPSLDHIAQERIGAELCGILSSGRANWALREQFGVMSAAIPELVPLAGFDQLSIYHCYDVLEHTIHVVESTEALTGGKASLHLRWAAMLHDVAKPCTLSVDPSGHGHFYGHPSAGAKMCDAIMRRMAIPLAVVEPAVALVRLHDRPMKPTRQSCLRMLAELERRMPGHGVDLSRELITIKRADALSKAQPYRGYAFELEQVATELERTIAQNPPYRLSDLAVTGNDLTQALRRSPGPWVGESLQALLDLVMADEVANERGALLSAVSGLGTLAGE